MDEASLRALLFELKKKGVENILALRGDKPRTMSQEEFDQRYFKYATDLIPEIKKMEIFIAGACYPEVHPESKNQEEDIQHLKQKVDLGLNCLITQMFLIITHFILLWINWRKRALIFRCMQVLCQ